jgi:hypothetical protein
VAIGNNTIKKNCGILRYTFGDAAVGPRVAQRASLLGGAAPVILTCLGADATVNPDSDDHIFGCSPGHAVINGAANTLFAGTSLLSMDDADVCGPRIAGPLQHRSTIRIPAGAKVWAQFIPTFAVLSAGLAPAVLTQVEVVQNGIFNAAVERTSAEAEPAQQVQGDWRTGVYLSSIRVAVKNIGTADTTAAGVLVVHCEWSGHELPGSPTQDQNFFAQIIG